MPRYNMSRNEAREMASALMRAGEGDLSAVFVAHSMVLFQQRMAPSVMLSKRTL